MQHRAVIALRLPPDSGAGREPVWPGLGEIPSTRLGAQRTSRELSRSRHPKYSETFGRAWERGRKKPLDAAKVSRRGCISEATSVWPHGSTQPWKKEKKTLRDLCRCENALPLHSFIFCLCKKYKWKTAFELLCKKKLKYQLVL